MAILPRVSKWNLEKFLLLKKCHTVIWWLHIISLFWWSYNKFTVLSVSMLKDAANELRNSGTYRFLYFNTKIPTSTSLILYQLATNYKKVLNNLKPKSSYHVKQILFGSYSNNKRDLSASPVLYFKSKWHLKWFLLEPWSCHCVNIYLTNVLILEK